ncbi:unnamed protein product [Schistosoma turkestanicum]|nr:unnamed protein product [Schistosoma turkestanicum]
MHRCIQFITLCIILVFQTCVLSNTEDEETTLEQKNNCTSGNHTCSRILFRYCCDGLVCNGFFSGTCVKCLGAKTFCIRHSECCSKYCWFFHCQPTTENVTVTEANNTESISNVTSTDSSENNETATQ